MAGWLCQSGWVTGCGAQQPAAEGLLVIPSWHPRVK